MSQDSFPNLVLPHWDAAMDAFFSKVEDRRLERGLTVDEVRYELLRGYGMDVADNWGDWNDEATS
jgi:hypothetical protein